MQKPSTNGGRFGLRARAMVTGLLAGLPIVGACHQHAMTAQEMYDALGWDFAAAQVTTEQVGPNLYVLFGLGGNVAVSVGEDGVLIVDDQFPEMMPKLKAAIGEVGGEGVDFVVNSHWHFDHADGNLVLGQEGSWIIAHANSRKLNTEDRTINLIGIGSHVQKAYPAHALAVDDAAKQAAVLGGAAGADVVAVYRQQLADFAAGFLDAFAVRDLGFGFTRLDDAGHALDQPGTVGVGDGAGSKLLDQHDFTAIRIVG